MAASKTSTTTTVEYAPAVQPAEYDAVRRAVSAATYAHIATEDRLIAIQGEDVTDEDLAPFVEQFIRQGALALAEQNATARIQAADRAIKAAQRNLNDAQNKMSEHSVRHAEVAADHLRSLLASIKDRIGTVLVQPIGASNPDHAGCRTGDVLVMVNDPAMSAATVYTILAGIVNGRNSTLTRENNFDFAFRWSVQLVDPEITEANRQRQAAEDVHHSFARAQYIADRGQV